MGDRNPESVPDVTEELFEPVIGEFSEEAYEGLSTVSSEKQRLAEQEQQEAEARMQAELAKLEQEKQKSRDMP